MNKYYIYKQTYADGMMGPGSEPCEPELISVTTNLDEANVILDKAFDEDWSGYTKEFLQENSKDEQETIIDSIKVIRAKYIDVFYERYYFYITNENLS
jgi:hypothetical protein